MSNLKLIKNLQKFRLVTFDITDTLLKFKIPPPIQYAKTASSFGYSNIDPIALESSMRAEFRIMYKEHPNFGKETPQMEWHDWWRKLVINIFNRTVPTISQKDADMIASKLIHQYRTSECWKEIKGAREIVSNVKSLNKIVGVISNFDPSLIDVLQQMELHNFDFILTSYDCGASKPNPKIFEEALDIYSLKPTEALHIGNTLELDYVGARKAGWSSLLISDLSNDELISKNVDTNHVFRSLEDLFGSLHNGEILW